MLGKIRVNYLKIDWNEDWGDPQDETSPSQSPFDTQLEEANKEDDWLSDCEVSVSSLGEIITIGRKDKLAVLQSMLLLSFNIGVDTAFS